MSRMEQGTAALGIDFGGTGVKLARVNEQGRIEARARFDTSAAPGVEAWLDRVAHHAAELGWSATPSESLVQAIGVGAPGFTDFERGFLHDLVNVPGWTGVPLARLLEQRFGLPAVVENDVNAMAVGESTFGAGTLYEHAVFVTLGTGVGGALILNRQLYRGAHSMAGEIGHMSVDLNGLESPEGRGGLELYIGNRAIIRRVREGIESGRLPGLAARAGGDPGRITPEWLAAAAAAGETEAVEEFAFLADCLATAFASLTYVLQPQVFLVGGGVAQSGEILFAPLRERLRARLSPFFAERVDVRPARLGPDAGVIGAATLALMKL